MLQLCQFYLIGGATMSTCSTLFCLVSMMDIGSSVLSWLASVLSFCWVSFLLAWCKLGWSWTLMVNLNLYVVTCYQSFAFIYWFHHTASLWLNPLFASEYGLRYKLFCVHIIALVSVLCVKLAVVCLFLEPSSIWSSFLVPSCHSVTELSIIL